MKEHKSKQIRKIFYNPPLKEAFFLKPTIQFIIKRSQLSQVTHPIILIIQLLVLRQQAISSILLLAKLTVSHLLQHKRQFTLHISCSKRNKCYMSAACIKMYLM